MPQETSPDPHERQPGLLERLKGNIAAITALVTTFTLLIGAVITFWDKIEELVGNTVYGGEGPPAVIAADCLRAEISVPNEVTVSEWRSMNVRLTGRSECLEKLAVYVAVKATGAETVQLEPPFSLDAACTLNSPDCWQQISLDPGDFELPLVPPLPVFLKRPLERPVIIYVNWIIYRLDNGSQLSTANDRIMLVDDPVGHSGSLATT